MYTIYYRHIAITHSSHNTYTVTPNFIVSTSDSLAYSFTNTLAIVTYISISSNIVFGFLFYSFYVFIL